MDLAYDNRWPVSIDTPEAKAAEDEYIAAKSAYEQWQNKQFEKDLDIQRFGYEGVRSKPDFESVVASVSDKKFNTSEAGSVMAYLTDPSYKDTTGTYADPAGLDMSGAGAYAQSLAIRDLYGPLEYLTDDEKSVMLYYAGIGDYDSVQKYYATLKPILKERLSIAETKELKALSNQSPAAGVMLNLAYAPYQGLAYLDTLAQSIRNKFGEYLPPTTSGAAFIPSKIVSATTEGVTQDMGPWGKFFTEAGLSAGQMLTALPLGPTGALAVMSSSAAGQTALQAVESGASIDQALALATMTGIIEAATEKIGIDNLLNNIFNGGKKGLIKALKNMPKQGLIEGAEEIIAEYANNLTDQAIMGANSQFEKLMEQIKVGNPGISDEDARHDAFVQLYIINPLKAGGAGTLMGLALSGSASMISPKVNFTATTQFSNQAPMQTYTSKPLNTFEVPTDIREAYTALQQDSVDARDKVVVPDSMTGSVSSMQTSPEVTIDKTSLDTAQKDLNSYKEMASYSDAPTNLKNVIKAQLEDTTGTTRQAEIADVSSTGKPYTVTIDSTPVNKFIDTIAAPDITPATLAILRSLDTVVQNGTYAGGGAISKTNIEGKPYSVPYETFQAPVTVGGERYLVTFNVTASPTNDGGGSGNVVHSIEIVKAPESNGGTKGSKPFRMKTDSFATKKAYVEQFEKVHGEQSLEKETDQGYHGDIQVIYEYLQDVKNNTEYFTYEQLKTEPNTAFFWSGHSNGIGGKEFAMQIAAVNKGTTLERLMNKNEITMPTWDISNPKTIKAWDYASAAYAIQVSGEVRAVIGSSVRPNSTWLRIELRILKVNPNVSKITIIDPETLAETEIFRRDI